MDSILEDKRSLHEERDRIELAIVNEILSKKNGHREKLDSEHRQKILLDRYMKCSAKLLKLYEQPQVRNNETDSAIDGGGGGTNAFNEFYLALREIKEYYNKHSNEQVVTLASEFDEIEAARQIAQGAKIKSNLDGDDNKKNDLEEDEFMNDDQICEDDQESGVETNDKLTRDSHVTTDLVVGDLAEQPIPLFMSSNKLISGNRTEKLVEFTDEEGYGRYLDLNKCHEAYLQVIKREEVKPNYLTFLNKFDRFTEFEREQKLTQAYKHYVEMLLEYFRDYCKRAKPLFDYQDMESKVHENFLEEWQDRKFAGWFRDLDKIKSDTPMIELESYRSFEELKELGLDCLKQELIVRGLKCGGTLDERAKRLWSVRGKRPNEIDDSIRAGPVVGVGKKKGGGGVNAFYIASIEAKLIMYAEYFADHRLATIENVQRKQARTAEERNDSDEDISDVEEDDVNQGDVIYNPKNLPLGWDGKPIPYWLYKLHGLNLTFTCEICGNATYKGPKTFQRHFAEWRHAHGMRCLGILNTAHFANITKIQDAISLWDKLKKERQKDKFQPLNEEEYEDSQGNVVNKKTYEDLKRQGLL